MSDAERKQKRLDILAKINKLSKLCKCNTTCEHCDAMKELGDQLIRLSKPRKKISADGHFVLGKSDNLAGRPKKNVRRLITVDEYAFAKKRKETDAAICKRLGMARSTLALWKNANVKEISIAMQRVGLKKNVGRLAE